MAELNPNPAPFFDLAILGNGIAANLFARHLALAAPELRVAIIGPAQTPMYNVGESVTEITSHYLQHRLGLSAYLYRNQLFKGGLRFFHDSPEKDLTIESMSEIGAERPSSFPTFHIERFTMEEELKRLNTESGVTYLDANIAGFSLGAECNVVYCQTGTSAGTPPPVIEVYARWLADGTGARALLATTLNLRCGNEAAGLRVNGTHCAAWGHFRTVNTIDKRAPEFKRRTGFLTREFTTTHLAYPGYWIWLIPLKSGLLSVGVVYDRRYLFPEASPTREDFLQFLSEHTVVRDLFDPSDLVNFAARRDYSYCSSAYTSHERFVLLGDAGAFIDPLYSPGLDMLSRESDIFVELIRRERAHPDDRAALEENVAKANLAIAGEYKVYETLILGNFLTMGSHEVWGLKYIWEFLSYFIGSIWPFIARRNPLDSPRETLEFDLRAQDLIYSLVAVNFRLLTEKFLAEGIYYRKNVGFHTSYQSPFYVERLLTSPLDASAVATRFKVLEEVLRFVLLRQAELYLHRRDLTCHQGLNQELRLSTISGVAETVGTEPKGFFVWIQNFLRAEENSHDWSEWMESTNESFWRRWFEAQARTITSRWNGKNFEYLYEALRTTPHEHFEAHEQTQEDPTLAPMVARWHRAHAQPREHLCSRNREALVSPCAAGLLQEGCTWSEVTELIQNQVPHANLGDIAFGCGFAAFQLGNTAQHVGDLGALISDYVAGVGCAMALGRSTGPEPQVAFPAAPQRSPLVRGFGRAVPLLRATAGGSAEVELYFRHFGLFPEDRADFERGVEETLSQLTLKPPSAYGDLDSVGSLGALPNTPIHSSTPAEQG